MAHYSELEIKAFKIVDDFLKKLEEGDPIPFYTFGQPKEYKIAEQLFKEHDLIQSRNPSNINSIVDITRNGLEVIKIGGIERYLTIIKEQDEIKQSKEILEYEKLRNELELIKNQLNDYSKTKKIALAAILISLLTFLFEIIKWSFS